MSTNCTVVPATLTLQQLVDEHVLSLGRRCFVVQQGDDAIGLLTLHRVKDAPRSEWATTTVADVMLRMAHLKQVRPDAEVWKALQEMDRDGVNQLPVVADGKLVGMLSRDDVISYLRTLQDVGVLATR
jgi:CBS domain-containing protein